LNGWPSRQPLQTVAVVRTEAGEGVGVPVVGNAHVAHLRVDQPMHQPAAQHTAAANAGADGEVEEGVKPLSCAPAMLAQRRAVDVGVEADRELRRPGQRWPSQPWVWW